MHDVSDWIPKSTVSFNISIDLECKQVVLLDNRKVLSSSAEQVDHWYLFLTPPSPKMGDIRTVN